MKIQTHKTVKKRKKVTIINYNIMTIWLRLVEYLEFLEDRWHDTYSSTHSGHFCTGTWQVYFHLLSIKCRFSCFEKGAYHEIMDAFSIVPSKEAFF